MPPVTAEKVAAGFADHRRRLARDGTLVHRRGAFDDLAVGGHQIAGLDQHHIAASQVVAETVVSLLGRQDC